MYVATERLYLTADRDRVVREGDPEAAFLLAGVGGELSAETAERYGLKQASAPTDKAVSAPRADKSGLKIDRLGSRARGRRE